MQEIIPEQLEAICDSKKRPNSMTALLRSALCSSLFCDDVTSDDCESCILSDSVEEKEFKEWLTDMRSQGRLPFKVD